MNEGWSGINKNRILQPRHPLCSSTSDAMPKIPAHTFSSECTSNIQYFCHVKVKDKQNKTTV